MIQVFVLSALIALLVALAGTYIAIKMQSRSLTKLHVQQEAWQRAQEAQLRTWEVRQGNHALDTEKKLTGHVRQVQEDWREWEVRDQERIAAMAREFEALMGKLNLEHELTRLPHIDETPLPSNGDNHRQQPLKNWRPPAFCGADLSRHDLSHRYLVRADFREARLIGCNFYMADLRDASFAGADLTDADLSGADLSGADLRSALLRGANLLVTDMHNALLNGADLRGVHNLTVDQAYSAIFDNATQFDENTDVTLPRLPSIRFTVYTESTPLVSLQSSQTVKQLEAPPNTIEAASTMTASEITEKHPAVSEILTDASQELPSPPVIPLEMPEQDDAPQPGIEDTSSPEFISTTAFPDANEEAAIEMAATIPHQAITLPETPVPEEIIDQLGTDADTDWAVPEETDFANGHSNGNSHHAHNGTATNGTDETATVAAGLDALAESFIEDTAVIPPASNGNSHTPEEIGAQSNTQGNKRTGGSGKVTSRKGQNGRRRARPNS